MEEEARTLIETAESLLELWQIQYAERNDAGVAAAIRALRTAIEDFEDGWIIPPEGS